MDVLLEILKAAGIIVAGLAFFFLVVAWETGLLGELAAERHLKKYGWCVYPSGMQRVDPDWLIRQPHVQKQLRQFKALVDRGVIKIKGPPHYPF